MHLYLPLTKSLEKQCDSALLGKMKEQEVPRESVDEPLMRAYNTQRVSFSFCSETLYSYMYCAWPTCLQKISHLVQLIFTEQQ